MKKKEILSYEDLRVLVAIADNRGHPLWELPYIMMDGSRNSKDVTRTDRSNAVKAIKLIDQGVKNKIMSKVRNDIDEINFSKVMIKKNKGKLSSRIKGLISQGWVIKNPQKRVKPDLHGPKSPGPDHEYPLYIPEEKYQFIDMIFHDELKVLRKKLKLMETEIFQKVTVKRPNGTSEEILSRAPRTPKSSEEYHRIELEFWSYAWLFWRWRHRVKILKNGQ